jgi:septal ring factor EnvC (AmiA/AmiB activator)
MRTLLTIALLTLSLGSHAATSNDCFKEQLTLAQQNVASYDFKGNVKALNDGIKSCRKAAADEKKAERAAKRRAKMEEQIKKLQAKLSSNT